MTLIFLFLNTTRNHLINFKFVSPCCPIENIILANWEREIEKIFQIVQLNEVRGALQEKEKRNTVPKNLRLFPKNKNDCLVWRTGVIRHKNLSLFTSKFQYSPSYGV